MQKKNNKINQACHRIFLLSYLFENWLYLAVSTGDSYLLQFLKLIAMGQKYPDTTVSSLLNENKFPNIVFFFIPFLQHNNKLSKANHYPTFLKKQNTTLFSLFDNFKLKIRLYNIKPYVKINTQNPGYSDSSDPNKGILFKSVLRAIGNRQKIFSIGSLTEELSTKSLHYNIYKYNFLRISYNTKQILLLPSL